MAGLVPYRDDRSLGGFGDFYNMMNSFFDSPWPFGGFSHGMFKVDVKENEQEYLVQADLPGVSKEQIDIEMREGTLMISLKQQEQKDDQEKHNYLHRERRYSAMSRTIYLPDARSEGITARMENGVLEVFVKKEQSAGPKSHRIPIQ